jgi:hypothetical protein
MSLSSIMSGNDEPPSYSKSQESRRSSRVAQPTQYGRPGSPTPTPTPAPAPATPSESQPPPKTQEKLVNGHVKTEVNGTTVVDGKARPDPDELLVELTRIGAMDDGDIKLLGIENWKLKYELSSKKRILAVADAESGKRKVRPSIYSSLFPEAC